VKPHNKLLRRIAAIPADEKLPISRFSRELNCSASVVVDMVQALVRDGHLDATTLRPGGVVEIKQGSTRRCGDIPASEIVPEIEEFLARVGMTPTRFAVDCMSTRVFMVRLRQPGRTLRSGTVARIRDYIANYPAAPTPGAVDCEEAWPHAKAPASSPPVGEGEAGGGFAPTPASSEPPPSPLHDRLPDGTLERITGEKLYQELFEAASRSGEGILDFSYALFSGDPKWKLEQLRMAKQPKAVTIVRVRALIAGEPLPETAQGETVPQQFARRSEREALGLPPSGREQRENIALSAVARDRAKVEHLRDINDTRHAQREQRLRDVVEREAGERAERRRQAGRLTTRHPLDVSDVVADALLDEIDTASDRRARELEELASPSSVLRRAQRDWPDQCAKVKALAEDLGVGLGEAWRRVIGAGVDCLTDPEAA
jgi:hypothetical protein